MAEKVAKTDVTVFIHGPTGTGKEVISNYIHQNSIRSEKPFVAINCAAIPENMLEAILFGHEKGAFTGASYANKGIFRAADKGTLLLDEISEMPLSLQAKLLRVLQEKKVTPVGGQRDIEIDVRVLATSNRDMVAEVKQSRFREDLYYRLNVINIDIPPLREREDDIIDLAKHFLIKFSNNQKNLDQSAVNYLKNYHWPGNVRELENIFKRICALSTDRIISKDQIIEFTDNFEKKTKEKIKENFDYNVTSYNSLNSLSFFYLAFHCYR